MLETYGCFNILFTNAGRRVALIQSFKKVLSNLGVPGIIVTTDSQNNSPAAFAADVSELVPRITDANYINILLGICQKYQIKLLIWLIDPELYLLSLHRQKFESKALAYSSVLLKPMRFVMTNVILLNFSKSVVFPPLNC